MEVSFQEESYIEIYKVKEEFEKKKISRDHLLAKISSKKLLSMYEGMVRTRAFDDKMKEMLNKGFSVSEHSTLGQEAGPIGVCNTINSYDYILPYHRGWAWAIGKGMEPKYLLSELLGKKTGYCQGKAGPHLGCYELGILGRSGVQSAHIPIGTGVGFGIKYSGEKKVCVVFFGDGASNNGNFHEALNMASVWKVPVIYFCENNSYALFSSAKDTTSTQNIGSRSLGYDMENFVIDGNDILSIYYATSKAVERARNGEGPTLIETKTYRWDGHNPIDKIHYGGYRPKEEVDSWKERCPINRLEKELLQKKILNNEIINKIKHDAEKEMDIAEEFAINSEYPTKDDYLSNVFC
ncbi:MAG: thiamine pyrophosphate-dependent dehydrogenase E1 component subunit alpha [Eubacteriales bacterium]